jgi:hypothetical protein
LTDTVEYSVDTLAVGNFLDLLLEGLVAVVDEDNMFCTVGTGDDGFLFGGDSANDVSAQSVTELGKEETYTAGGRVDYDPVTLLNCVALGDQAGSRYTLQYECRTLSKTTFNKSPFRFFSISKS